MTCMSDITREFKTRKAECVWPVYDGAIQPSYQYKNACFGRVTATLKAVDEPYFGGTSAELHIEWTCSRCTMPFVEKRLEIDAMVGSSPVDLERLAELIK